MATHSDVSIYHAAFSTGTNKVILQHMVLILWISSEIKLNSSYNSLEHVSYIFYYMQLLHNLSTISL